MDFVEIASRYLELKKVGRQYAARCPFHPDRNPSFFIDPEKKLYHCFGCGASGDVIKFVMEMEGLGFSEAVEFLAKEAGVVLPQPLRKEPSPIFEIMRLIIKVLAGKLSRERALESGLSQRGIEELPLGWNDGSPVLDNLPSNLDGETKRKLELVLSPDLRLRFDEGFICPFYSARGAPVALAGKVSGRDTLIALFPVDLFLPGAREELKTSKVAYVTFSWRKAISEWDKGRRGVVVICGRRHSEVEAAKKVIWLADGEEGKIADVPFPEKVVVETKEGRTGFYDFAILRIVTLASYESPAVWVPTAVKLWPKLPTGNLRQKLVGGVASALSTSPSVVEEALNSGNPRLAYERLKAFLEAKRELYAGAIKALVYFWAHRDRFSEKVISEIADTFPSDVVKKIKVACEKERIRTLPAEKENLLWMTLVRYYYVVQKRKIGAMLSTSPGDVERLLALRKELESKVREWLGSGPRAKTS